MENFQTEYGKSFLKEHMDIIEYMEKHAGLKLPSTRHLGLLRDMIKVQVSTKRFKNKFRGDFLIFF